MSCDTRRPASDILSSAPPSTLAAASATRQCISTARRNQGVLMFSSARICLSAALLAFGVCASAQDSGSEGQKQFDSQCSSCHTVKPGVNGFGPSLAGVVGRPAGHVPGFTYSGAMASSGLVWDEATLDAFLADTSKKVPGTSMPVTIPDAHVRSVIIAYLRNQTTMMAPSAAAAPSEAAATAK